MTDQCECCDMGLPATKINGIYCCVRCDNFECKQCGAENDKTGGFVSWNDDLKMCVCDNCIKPAPKIVISDVVVTIRRPKKYKADILLKKLDGCGIDILVSILGKEFKCRITNMKSSSIPLEKRKSYAIHTILKYILKTDDSEATSDHILKTYFTPIAKEPKQTEWVNDFVVGEEVISRYAPQERKTKTSICRKGIVSKINKTSITVRLFGYKEINDMYAIQNQTYGNNRLIWEAHTNDTQVISSRRAVCKKGEESYIDEYFVEGKRQVDWGW